MGDYNVDPDYDGPVHHVIWCRSAWPQFQGEKHTHETVAQVADCFRKERVRSNDPARYFSCDWLVEVPGFEGPVVVPCGALAYSRDDGGFDCEAGHEHTPAWVLEA